MGHGLITFCFPCSGDVVTMECVEKLIRKDMIHPLTDRKLKEKDIIPLQRVREHGLANERYTLYIPFVIF